MSETRLQLVVDDHRTIAAVKEDFNKAFPYLKIEFFKQPHGPGQGSARKNMYDDSVEIRLIRKKPGSDRAEIRSAMKVHDFEKQLESDFGLHVQVFRKSGNVWLETSATDSWTLDEQNEEGKSLAQQLKTERENPEDHDMYG
jgi:hypothetical protein